MKLKTEILVPALLEVVEFKVFNTGWPCNFASEPIA
jgi:hypothetical protein